MKAPKIYCEISYDVVKEQAYHEFYVTADGKKYYLFKQEYRKGVREYFRQDGVTLDRALNNGYANSAVRRTIDKLPNYIRYIEKEYGIAILNKTKKKEALYA